jgi:hypothetical protein
MSALWKPQAQATVLDMRSTLGVDRSLGRVGPGGILSHRPFVVGAAACPRQKVKLPGQAK